MAKAIRRFVTEFPILVWLIAAVFVLDFYLLALTSLTRTHRDYRLKPDSEVNVAAGGKPSPFGETRKRAPLRYVGSVAVRPGDAVLARDQERLTPPAPLPVLN